MHPAERKFILRALKQLGSLPFFFAATLAVASPGAQTEIRVTLFGQPCMLQGPLDEATLRQVHAISPEEIVPFQAADGAAEPYRKAIGRLQSAGKLPALLDRYRERMGRRLEAQLGFFEGLDNARKSHKSDPLLAGTRKFLPARALKEFENRLKHTELARRDQVEQLYSAYIEAIEADPEEEFHRAIHRLGVQYVCSFEEHLEGDEE